MNKQKYVYSIILMIITPLMTLIYALRQQSIEYKRWMIVFFTTIYGSTWGGHAIGDGIRHWANVYNYYVELSFLQFLADLADILTFVSHSQAKDDVYIHVISYLVGGVLGLPGLFFVVVAFIYGYFFAGSMVKTFKIFPTYKRSLVFLCLAITFIMMLNIQSMNTVRTWTGFWILYYGCISYYQTGKIKYLWLLIIPPFVHVGFFMLAIPTWLVVFVGIRKTLFASLFFMSFVTTIIDPEWVLAQIGGFEVGQDKIRGYYVEETSTMEETMEDNQDNRWYLTYRRLGIWSYGISVLAALFIVSGRYFTKMNRLEMSMFSIGILTQAFSNSTWFLYAVSNRSGIIAYHFILAAILIYWQREYLKQGKIRFSLAERLIVGLVVLALLPWFIYVLSTLLEYTSVYMLFWPFNAWLSYDARMSIREAIGFFL